MMRKTVGQAIAVFLDRQYVMRDGKKIKFVEGIFTIFGHGNVCGLGEALAAGGHSLRVYQGRNEQGMCHAAVGFAKQNNRQKIIACTSSIGPGAANMVTACALATANHIPLLVLTGDTFATRQSDPVLQQIEQPYSAAVTTSDAFKPVCRYWDRVNRPEQLLTALINAFRVLTDPELAGGVCISLPQDVQGEVWDFPESFLAERIHTIERRRPDETLVKQAVDCITHSRKPLVICGGGVRYSESGSELLSFCESLGIPFAETQAGKGCIAGSEPLNLGGIGVTGNSAANTIAKESDLIIGVGTRFTDFTTASKWLFQHPDVRFLSINLSGFDAGKLDALPLIGDVKVCLAELLPALKNARYHAAYSGEVEAAQVGWRAEMERLSGYIYPENGTGFQPLIKERNPNSIDDFILAVGGVITQTAALSLIHKTIEDDAIVVGASGSLPGDLQRMWTTDCAGGYHLEYGYSCMGYEIAAAVGVKLAEPTRSVYSMVGDGAFLMLHSELITARQEGIKITVLLFDNCGFGCINNLQMGQGIASLATEFRFRNEKTGEQDGAMIPIDYAMVARGYGLRAYTVRTLDELAGALKEAMSSPESVLIDIKVLPKTMTGGYGAWWHVGIAGDSTSKQVRKAYEQKEAHLVQARKY